MLPETILTERLRLRKPIISDAQILFEKYGQDPDVCKFMTWRPLTRVTQAEAFIAQTIEDWDRDERRAYILELVDKPGDMIGMLDAEIQGHMIEFGYVLAQENWGQGLMPEAVTELTNNALRNDAFSRIQASCDVENIASARTLEKSGFLREGRLASYTLHPNISPTPRDCYLFARTG